MSVGLWSFFGGVTQNKFLKCWPKINTHKGTKFEIDKKSSSKIKSKNKFRGIEILKNQVQIDKG